MNYTIEFKDVTVRYGQIKALDKVNFKLTENQIYAFIGRNGAGKTTLLSLLASFRLPTLGTIKINDVNPFENRALMRQISFVYNKDYSSEGSTVKQYLTYGAYYRPNFDLAYAESLLKRFDIPLNKSVSELSSGKQSALNATLGLASRSPITIFDEVYLSMDAPARDLFYKELLKEQEMYPRIIILSTHLISEMDYLFDHVLIIDDGQIIVDDSFDHVVSRGYSVIGNKKMVDDFVYDKKKLSTQSLGNTKSVMIYGALSDQDLKEAQEKSLEIGSVSLNDLFIHLTIKEGQTDEE